MKEAAAFLRQSIIFIEPISKTTQGFPISTPPCFKISLDSLPEISQAIIAALEISTENYPHPRNNDEWNRLLSDLFKKSGVKRWTTFAKGTREVRITEIGNNQYELDPTRNLGPKEGFEGISQKEFTVSKENLAEGLIKAFELCEFG